MNAKYNEQRYSQVAAPTPEVEYKVQMLALFEIL